MIDWLFGSGARLSREPAPAPEWRIPASMLSKADEIKRLRAENERLREAYMRRIQLECGCSNTGAPCREPAKCGCHLELGDDLAEALSP